MSHRSLVCLTLSITLWGFLTGCDRNGDGGDNRPPNPPSDPFPSDAATSQSDTVDVSWACSDPDGDPLTYDVYFGAFSPPPLTNSGQVVTTYDPGTLVIGTTYHWRIVARDGEGHSTDGPIWRFTTGFGDMVLIPSGSFWMGAEYLSWALPIHSVNVPGFYIDMYEVTNAQYKAFCDATSWPYPPDPGFDSMPNYFTNAEYASYPVVNVDWNEARAYATWAGKRLPSEAEWERAAKGNTDNRRYPWGDSWDASRANGSGAADGWNYTAPVNSFPTGVSPAGCFNMAGNVKEWCEDDLHFDYDGAPSDGSAWVDNPRGPSRVGRGGSWNRDSTYAQCSWRDSDPPTRKRDYFGFRCVLTP